MSISPVYPPRCLSPSACPKVGENYGGRPQGPQEAAARPKKPPRPASRHGYTQRFENQLYSPPALAPPSPLPPLLLTHTVRKQRERERERARENERGTESNRERGRLIEREGNKNNLRVPHFKTRLGHFVW